MFLFYDSSKKKCLWLTSHYYIHRPVVGSRSVAHNLSVVLREHTMSGSVSFTPLLQVTARTSFGEIVLLWFKHLSAFEVLFKAFENHAEHNADWTNELFLLLINALGVSVVGSVGQCWLAIHCCHVYHITRIINLESIVIETSTVVSTCYSFLFCFFF